MVRGVPKDLGRKKYYSATDREKGVFWLRYLSGRLGISLDDIRQRIIRTNGLPIKEYEELSEGYEFLDGTKSVGFEPVGKDVAYPRLSAHASLLAQASKCYDGPRGPRPILASAENIYRLSVFPKRHDGWRVEFFEEHGGIDKFLIDMKLSASNPHEWGRVVQFSSEDVRRGVYIPNRMGDMDLLRALGIIYADGYLSENDLRLTGRYVNLELYSDVIPQAMEGAFNFMIRNPAEIEAESHFSDASYKFLRHTYSSAALSTYLANVHGFPRNEEEKRAAGLSPRIKKLSSALLAEFMRYYLGTKAAFGPVSGVASIGDVSEPLMEDIRKTIADLGFPTNIGIYLNGKNTFQMHFGRAPTMELYYAGFFEINPILQDKITDFIDRRPERRVLYKKRYSRST